MDGNGANPDGVTDLGTTGTVDDLQGFSERELSAYRLRLAGASYRQIAKAVGYAGPSPAYHAVKRVFASLVQEPTDEVRQLEVERLDALYMKLWTAIEDTGSASEGDQDPTPFENLDKAAHTLLRISKRRSELIGLDAPRRIDITKRIRDMAVEEGLDPDQAVADAVALIAGE